MSIILRALNPLKLIVENFSFFICFWNQDLPESSLIDQFISSSGKF